MSEIQSELDRARKRRAGERTFTQDEVNSYVIREKRKAERAMVREIEADLGMTVDAAAELIEAVRSSRRESRGG